MYDIESYINKPLQEIECIFREYNQPTYVYLIKGRVNALIDTFGTNEGGPSYTIFVNTDGIVVKIEETDVMSFLNR